LNIRDSVLEELKVLAESGAQLQYVKPLTDVRHAPTELVSVYCDDLSDPQSEAFLKEFSRDEHKDLTHLYGLHIEVAESQHSSVSEMLKDSKWRRVVEVAQQLRRRFRAA